MVEMLLESVVYLCLGISIMMIGNFLVDLVIPVDFPKEIHEGNKSVGWVSAGIYAGLGYIIRTAIASFSISDNVKLIDGVKDTAIYSVMGIVAFIIAYFVIDLCNKKFNYNEALKDRNEAAGIMIFGIFIGVAFIVSGVIQ
ncbi:MAG: DUF350 domain-containing protein [Lachnospiraceae bacterium]|nr:DUF350 domain-containing protein [Lachnospiraceae bacterium]